jgi:hypothetical protein
MSLGTVLLLVLLILLICALPQTICSVGTTASTSQKFLRPADLLGTQELRRTLIMHGVPTHPNLWAAAR